MYRFHQGKWGCFICFPLQKNFIHCQLPKFYYVSSSAPWVCCTINYTIFRYFFLQHRRPLEDHHLVMSLELHYLQQEYKSSSSHHSMLFSFITCNFLLWRLMYTSSGGNLLKPNLLIHNDSASSAAGRTRFFTFKNPKNLSMHAYKDWK